jgi:autotransporter passenger strand-loop-strand repeat protein
VVLVPGLGDVPPVVSSVAKALFGAAQAPVLGWLITKFAFYADAAVNQWIDPASGSEFEFTETGGSPLIQSVTFFDDPNVASFNVQWQVGSSWSAPQIVTAGVKLSFGAGTTGFEFEGLSSSGQVVLLPNGYLFDETFVSSGQVSATLSEVTPITSNAIVSSGQTASGVVIGSGGHLVVQFGGAVLDTTLSAGEQDIYGTASNTVVSGGAVQVVESGGTAGGTIVSSGGLEIVNFGGTDNGATVLSGGNLAISAGGTGSGTTLSGGQAVVYAGGNASNDVVLSSSFLQLGLLSGSAGGTASGTIIYGNGTEIVHSGGADFEARLSGGSLQVFAGGTEANDVVLSGGLLLLGVTGFGPGGTASGTIISNGGTEIVSSGGTDHGATVNEGGQLILFAGGKLISTTVTGNSNFDLNGGFLVISGGMASGTVISEGGGESVKSGGTDFGATVLSGGSIVVLSGGTIVSAAVVGSGAFDLNGGVLALRGGTASGSVVSSGGFEDIKSGGTDFGATVLGGGQANVSSGGSTVSASIIGSGTTNSAAEILSGGMASHTMLFDTGKLTVRAGGIALDTIVNSTSFGSGSNGGLFVSSGGMASNATVNSGGIEGVRRGGRDIGATINSGGLLVVSSGGTASATTIDGGTLELQVGGVISGAISFTGQGGTLMVDSSPVPASTISGFAGGDIIDLASIGYDSAGSANLDAANDQLVVAENGHSYDLQLAGSFSGEYFHLAAATGGGTLITESTACYRAGTLILTARGEQPVERLRIGDELVTMAGAARPIKWIGQRSYSGRRALGQKHIQPICFKAGSLDEGIPRRDLWISPHHAMFTEGVLIEAKDLINAVTIVQAEWIEPVEYFHIELDTHDVIIAEGALSESFIDDDSRGMFHNAHEYWSLYPDTQVAPARYCAARHQDGYEVEAARRRIALRAGMRAGDREPPVHALRGCIDLIGPRRIAGWAQNVSHPEAPVCLDLYAGDRLIGRTLANRYRADLERAGLGSGHHSFEFTAPAALVVALEAIEVRRSLDGARLPMATP